MSKTRKPRTVEVNGKAFLVSSVDDLPPTKRRTRTQRKVYPEDVMFERLRDGEAFLVQDPERTLQDTQSWWALRFRQIALKVGMSSSCRRDNDRNGVWFFKVPKKK